MYGCSALCAEMHGPGKCPGETCVYRPDGDADRRRRTNRAEEALAVYRDEDRETCATDLLADLMLYLGDGFGPCLSRALVHYEHERVVDV